MGSPHDPVPLSHRPGCGGPRLAPASLRGVRNPPHPWTTGIKRGARPSWAGASEGHWGRDLPAASVLAPGTSLFQEGGGAHLLLSSRQPPHGQGRANGWCAPGLRGDPSGHLPGCRVSGSSKTAGVGILLFTLGLGSTRVAFPAPIQRLSCRVCVCGGGDDRSAPLSLREAAGGAGPYLPTELLPLEKAPQSEDSALWVSGPPPSWPAVIRENLTFPLSGVSPHELSKYGAHLERVWGLCPQTHQQW